MPGQLHLGKVTLANGLEEPVIPNMGLLISRGGRVTAPKHVGLAAGLGLKVSQGGLQVETDVPLHTVLQFPKTLPSTLQNMQDDGYRKRLSKSWKVCKEGAEGKKEQEVRAVSVHYKRIQHKVQYQDHGHHSLGLELLHH